MQILDNVRNRLLSFALELEKREGSVIGSTIESPPSTEAISQVFNTYIMGGQNIVGNVMNITQIEEQIITGNLSSLNQALLNAGISDEDIAELEKAIEHDDIQPKEKKLGSKVKEWLGGMIQKAGSGVWKISLDVATNLLTKALFRYYGWS